MNAVANPDNTYAQVIRKFVAAWKEGEAANIRRYYDLGRLFDEFCGGVERAVYGEKAVDNLLQDLSDLGVFKEGEDGRRRLYWARGVYRTYPDFSTLEQLSERGFTLTHLKALLGVSDNLRTQAEQLLLRNGKVIPTREFVEGVAKLCQDAVRNRAQAVTATETREANVVATEPPEDEVTDDPAMEGDGGPVLTTPTPEDAPVPAAAQQRPVTEAAPVSQRPIKDMDKALTRVMALVPEVLITVKGKAQEGFDSEVARRKYMEQLRTLVVEIRDLREPLTVLISEIEGELGTDLDAIPATE